MIKVSIIIPCRNEEKHIIDALNSIIYGDYSMTDMEILIVDGRSNDKTRDIVREFEKKHKQIKLIDNPQQTVPYAMNYGIKEAKGDIIIRLDAHSIYPKDYISQLIYWLDNLDADNVGGVIEPIFQDNNVKANAIAYSSSHIFGVGNSKFRLQHESTEPLLVDTVPFGCFRAKVFEKVGLYDTDLIRNQDDELNARIIQHSGKIYLIPTLKVKYYTRNSFSKLFKMFYQYGYFKPLVNKKLKKPATFRQFIPLLFVLFIIIGGLLCLVTSFFNKFFLLIICFYFIINFFVSIGISMKDKNFKLLPYLIVSFFVIHISYGLGYLRGIIDFIIFDKSSESKNINISR